MINIAFKILMKAVEFALRQAIENIPVLNTCKEIHIIFKLFRCANKVSDVKWLVGQLLIQILKLGGKTIGAGALIYALEQIINF